jgi:NAD+ kinase
MRSPIRTTGQNASGYAISRRSVSAQSVIEVRLRASRDDEAHTTFDGQRGFALSAEDTLTVTSSPRTLRLVKVPDRDYFKVLRTKLKWGETTARRPGS